MNQNITKTLLERFSCTLVRRGKKGYGHKILLESLFILRQKRARTILNLRSLNFVQKKVSGEEQQIRKVRKSFFFTRPKSKGKK